MPEPSALLLALLPISQLAHKQSQCPTDTSKQGSGEDEVELA